MQKFYSPPHLDCSTVLEVHERGCTGTDTGTANVKENCQRMETGRRSSPLFTSELYFDTSDAEYWDQVAARLEYLQYPLDMCRYLHSISYNNTYSQETSYLSEHNYEETLDEETARKLLNFGDDYRNFLESNNSEVQSPRNFDLVKKKRYPVPKVMVQE